MLRYGKHVHGPPRMVRHFLHPTLNVQNIFAAHPNCTIVPQFDKHLWKNNSKCLCAPPISPKVKSKILNPMQDVLDTCNSDKLDTYLYILGSSFLEVQQDEDISDLDMASQHSEHFHWHTDTGNMNDPDPGIGRSSQTPNPYTNTLLENIAKTPCVLFLYTEKMFIECQFRHMKNQKLSVGSIYIVQYYGDPIMNIRCADNAILTLH